MNTSKRLFTYLLGVCIIVWIIASFFIGYNYLITTGDQEDKKGGTFVEAIFDQVSYLPYLRNDGQSLFYQSFLFKGCLDYKKPDPNFDYKQDLCVLTTPDYKTYTVELAGTGTTWSDGTPLTIEDIFFTYDDIVRQNRWGIKSLNTYQEIKVSLEDGKIKVVFPISTVDNNAFFTQYILPKHVLGQATLDDYKSKFALSPVYSSCGRIIPQKKDVNSLVFDLNKCEDTNLGFYQIKNYDNFEDFRNSVENGQNSLIDIYMYNQSTSGYQKENVLSTKLLALFFNTKSEKAKVRLRRSLGGLIYHNFYTGEYQNFLKPYDGSLLNYYLSDGSNVSEFINRMSLSEDAVQKANLEDSGAKILPESMSVNGVERKFVFYMEHPDKVKNLEIKFSNEFDKIKVQGPNNKEFSPKSYNKKNKKIDYKLTPGENLNPGLNKYTVSGEIKGKTYVIATIDLYSFENLQQPEEENQWKLNILYYNNPESVFVTQRLKDIFTKAGIIDNFIFEQVQTPEELEGKLMVGDYDILINTVDLGTKKDILRLFNTDDPAINPSKYTNPNLTNLFKQYAKNPDKAVQQQINDLFANDMPVIILGTTYSPLWMKEDIADKLFASMTGSSDIYEYNWREKVYNDLNMVHNTKINFESAANTDTFLNYLYKNVYGTDIPKTSLGTGGTGQIQTGIVPSLFDLVQPAIVTGGSN